VKGQDSQGTSPPLTRSHDRGPVTPPPGARGSTLDTPVEGHRQPLLCQKKSAREAVSAWGMKTVRLRFPHRIRYSQRCHEDTLLGLLEVMIAALGSSIITSTDFVLPH